MVCKIFIEKNNTKHKLKKTKKYIRNSKKTMKYIRIKMEFAIFYDLQFIVEYGKTNTHTKN